jgi:N-acetylmuramoyl-L-alanine amidase
MKTLKLAILALGLSTVLSLGTAIHARPGIQAAKAQDIECLARNIYHEARGEGFRGQIAVAQVTLNRVRNPKFHNTVCGVVYAHRQFSWTLDKSKRVRDKKAWQHSLAIARAVLTQSVQLPHFTATHFHTRQVKPSWAKHKRVVAVINNHIFYS